MTLPCILFKTTWGYIDILNTWEGWTLIGAVVLALAILAWMEWGKVRCQRCEIKDANVVWMGPILGYVPCPACHGSGRVRRGWLSRIWRKKW